MREIELKCDNCGHAKFSHYAAEDYCTKCGCKKFVNNILIAWAALHPALKERQSFTDFYYNYLKTLLGR